jgi:hypothetical protein
MRHGLRIHTDNIPTLAAQVARDLLTAGAIKQDQVTLVKEMVDRRLRYQFVIQANAVGGEPQDKVRPRLDLPLLDLDI